MSRIPQFEVAAFLLSVSLLSLLLVAVAILLRGAEDQGDTPSELSDSDAIMYALFKTFFPIAMASVAIAYVRESTLLTAWVALAVTWLEWRTHRAGRPAYLPGGVASFRFRREREPFRYWLTIITWLSLVWGLALLVPVLKRSV